MPVTYVIFNTVHFDGMGDFSHFKDLMHALLVNPLYRDVQFISVVCSEHFDEKRNANILKAMPALNRGGFYFGSLKNHREKIETDKELLSILATADQAICISYNDGLLDLYLPHMKKNLPIKAIGAHEAPLFEPRAKYNKVLYSAYPLGLDKNRGIKIAPPPSSDRATLWQKIKKNNTACCNSLEMSHFETQ